MYWFYRDIVDLINMRVCMRREWGLFISGLIFLYTNEKRYINTLIVYLNSLPTSTAYPTVRKVRRIFFRP